jgi:hypothetical protein
MKIDIKGIKIMYSFRFFGRGRVAQSAFFSALASVLWIISFLLAIALSIFLPFTNSDYPL